MNGEQQLEGLNMNDGYCFRCGAYTVIDQLTKMCRPCLDHWCATPRRRWPA